MRSFFILFLGMIFLMSCKKSTNIKTQVDVSTIKANVNIDRFDIDFYQANEKTLKQIKLKYPMLFPVANDSVWLQKINDKDEQELFLEVQKKYPSVKHIETSLEALFKHIKYYNTKFSVPRVITMLTNIDYDSRITISDNLLFISLDAYLGATHEFYNDYPNYIKQNNTEAHIIVDVAKAYINKQVKPNRNRRFIDKMIAEGKKMYLLDCYLPTTTDAEKIGYTAEKFAWAKNSEENIWMYFISKDMLYSTDMKLNKRFLDIAPFSKFYMGEDNLSPGRIGVYIGWQIVRAYMQNNDVSLPQLMKTSEEEIFQKSKYKPKR